MAGDGRARLARVEALFHGALSLPPDEHAAWLAAHASGDAALAAEVLALLAADAEVSDILDSGSPGGAVVARAMDGWLGDAARPGRAGGEGATAALRERLQAALGAAYRVERELDGGAMSRVFVAEEVHLGRRVAVKVVLAPEIGAAFNVARFRREVRLAAALRHPHIVPLLAAGESADGLVYYTMPFIDGESLKQRLDREGALPLDDVVRVVSDVADALSYAHRRGVIHRDVKPANILVDEDHALVADFGIAKALSAAVADDAPPPTSHRPARHAPDASVLTLGGLVLGTPAYMSPEQAAGAGAVDARTDVYSLGAVAYELLTGAPPPSSIGAGRTPSPDTPLLPVSARRADAPPGVDAVVARALARRPVDRWPSAAAFAGALAEALGRTPLGGNPGATPGRPRRRALAALAAGLGLAAAAALLRPATGPTGLRVAAQREAAGARPTDNFDAYNYFLRAEALRKNTVDEGTAKAQAIAMYERATTLDPGFALAYARLAEVHSELYWSYTDRSPQRLARVRAAATTAVRLAPELAEAHLALALFYYRALRDYRHALAELATAIAHAPTRSDLVALRGLIQRREGRYGEAIESLRRADELEPSDPWRASDVAFTYAQMRAYPDAARYYDRVRMLAPTWSIVHADLAFVALAGHGDVHEARRIVREGLRTSDPAEVAARIGSNAPLLIGPGADTRRVLRGMSVRTFKGDTVSYLLWYADWWRQRGAPGRQRAYADSARSLLERQLGARDGEAGLHDQLAFAYAELGRRADAMRESDRAVRLLPVARDALDGANYLTSRAYIYTLVGAPDSAVAALRHLLTIPAFVSVPLLRVSPMWDALRGHPGFARLVESDSMAVLRVGGAPGSAAHRIR